VGLWPGRATPTGVDIEMSAMLFFSDERTASFDCGFTTKGRCWLELVGSEATLSLDDFVVPRSEDESAFWLSKRIATRWRAPSDRCVQEARMIERFSSVVQSGQLDPKLAPGRAGHRQDLLGHSAFAEIGQRAESRVTRRA